MLSEGSNKHSFQNAPALPSGCDGTAYGMRQHCLQNEAALPLGCGTIACGMWQHCSEIGAALLHGMRQYWVWNTASVSAGLPHGLTPNICTIFT